MQSKYIDPKSGGVIDPHKDAAPFDAWRNGIVGSWCSRHPEGFFIFGEPGLAVADEYEEGDPYGVAVGLEEQPEFHRARKSVTISLISRISSELSRRVFTVLDLGCGSGFITREIKRRYPGAQIDGLDSSVSAIRSAVAQGEGIDYVVADAYSPPYADNFYDVVICNNIWEHVPDPLRLLEAIKRITKPGGFVLISTPSRYRLRNLMRILLGKRVSMMSKLHVTEYTVGQVKEQLRFGGFDVIATDSLPYRRGAWGVKRSVLDYVVYPVCRQALRVTGSHHSLSDTVFYLARRKA